MCHNFENCLKLAQPQSSIMATIKMHTTQNNINRQLNNDKNNDKNNNNNKNKEKFIVKYRQNLYDLSEFMHKHPGGINTLKGLNNADMTSRFMKAPPHSDAAMYLMKEYKLNDKNQTENSHSSNARTGNIMHDVEIKENGVELIADNGEDNNNNQLDESMEHLVDWSKPMLPQIAGISRNYNVWVHKPVDRELRLFGPWYLEICTKTPWWVVPTFWIPVIVMCALDAIRHSLSHENMTQFYFVIAYFCFGILFWTLLEYVLHRWVFHMHIDSNSSPWLCTFHFLIHGLHHKVPFDPLRLVFPPFPGVILATIIYTPLSFTFPQPRVLLSGALFGYLCYDMIHYYLHYGNPNLKHLYDMKRYHYQHHFAHQDMGYGISSPMWDLVFQTRIHLRKLRYKLHWA